tara:strand:- start:752 stop:871 length:120 start_codon:yes stop_codon:yes gene_type:complete
MAKKLSRYTLLSVLAFDVDVVQAIFFYTHPAKNGIWHLL